MSRHLPEWVARHDDQRVPPHVRARVFDRHGGICHISGRKIMAGERWELEHVKALILGGEHRELNLAPALVAPHRVKSAGEVALKAKIARTRQKHLGIKSGPGFRRHATHYRGIDGVVRERRS